MVPGHAPVTAMDGALSINRYTIMNAPIFRAAALSALLALLVSASVHAVPITGLEAAYTFSGDATDSSGNNHDGTVNGAVLTTDRFGNADSAYQFASGDTIDIPTATLTGSAGTVSLWFYSPTLLTGSEADYNQLILFQAIDTADSRPKVNLGVGNYTSAVSGEILGVTGPQGPSYERSAVAVGDVGSIGIGWHHLVFMSDPGGHGFYLDGVDLSPSIFNGGWSASTNLWSFDGITEAVIGYYSSEGSYAVDDVYIYDRALTGSEVTTLYTDGQVPAPATALLLLAGLVAARVRPRSRAV